MSAPPLTHTYPRELLDRAFQLGGRLEHFSHLSWEECLDLMERQGIPPELAEEVMRSKAPEREQPGQRHMSDFLGLGIFLLLMGFVILFFTMTLSNETVMVPTFFIVGTGMLCAGVIKSLRGH